MCTKSYKVLGYVHANLIFFQKKREATFFLCFKSAFVPYNEWDERAFKAQEKSSSRFFWKKLVNWRERTLKLLKVNCLLKKLLTSQILGKFLIPTFKQ